MLVLLDRDGVINVDRPDAVKSLSEFRFIDGSVDAIVALNRAGYRIAIVTNQSVVGRGLLTDAGLAAIHDYLRGEVAAAGGHIDKIYACTDHPDRPTHRRKPAPGMVLEALADFAAEASRTALIGDALRDLQAAHTAGCPYYLVRSGVGEATLAAGLPADIMPRLICNNLSDAVQHLLQNPL